MIHILQHLFNGAYGPSIRAFEDWQLYVLLFLAIVVATTVHEFGHAWMADRLGDPTPRREGRVRLSPLAHLDPLGTLLLIVTMLIGFPIGWGKPVRTNPENYKCGQRKGIALVAAAGPLMNLVTAFLLAPLARFILGGGLGTGQIAVWLLFFVAINMLVSLSLFCFNLVPVHPLDGSHITASALPEELSKPYRAFMQRFGTYILIGLMWSGTLGKIIGPMVLAIFLFLIGR
jgi:Zn-dependent protease